MKHTTCITLRELLNLLVVINMWKIGNVEIKNQVVMAPMAGITNIAFRKLIKSFGAGLVVSEMISDKAICYRNEKTLDMLAIDELGLDAVDRNMLTAMIVKFGGRPVGLDTIAAATGEDASTIEDVYEPYLLRLGFIARTPRGRVLLPAGYSHMGYAPPQDSNGQTSFI